MIYVQLALGHDPGKSAQSAPVIRNGPVFGPYIGATWDLGQKMRLLKGNNKTDVLLLVSMMGVGAVYYDKLWWKLMTFHTEKPEFVDGFDRVKAND